MPLLKSLPKSTPFWFAVAFAAMSFWTFLAAIPSLFALAAYSPERQADLAIRVAAANMLERRQEIPPAALQARLAENEKFQGLLAQETAGQPAPYAAGYAAGFAAAGVHAHKNGIALRNALGLVNSALLNAIIALTAWYYHKELRQSPGPRNPAPGRKLKNAGATANNPGTADPLPAERSPAPVPE